MDSIIFLTLDEAIDVHMDLVNRYGGHRGIRDIDLLLSALAMPQASFGGEFLHRDIFEAAAAYAFHICNNHPFVDGNKRTALACALVFLELNAIETRDPDGTLYVAMIDVASGGLSKQQLADIFRTLSVE
ncbi:MAG: type II toxin-antitoxin system death-on-curing family toxin [Firmicutes bacterium]|jgi:death-on-curing protein|nr:type II toxin-antitoxin system death-on-curing family toxin [Bacillota bacterium]MDD4336892.1 type II toxin-antitoxin system death-on-curing family toxin [Bacillota bacterium]MDD4791457.1 type II toxin-antitoxin system death-on-curing family toxin [Bacillota bacterium]